MLMYEVCMLLYYYSTWIFFTLHGRWPTSSCPSHPWRTPGPRASVAELASVGVTKRGGERIRMEENVMTCHCPWFAEVYTLGARYLKVIFG